MTPGPTRNAQSLLSRCCDPINRQSRFHTHAPRAALAFSNIAALSARSRNKTKNTIGSHGRSPNWGNPVHLDHLASKSMDFVAGTAHSNDRAYRERCRAHTYSMPQVWGHDATRLRWALRLARENARRSLRKLQNWCRNSNGNQAFLYSEACRRQTACQWLDR